MQAGAEVVILLQEEILHAAQLFLLSDPGESVSAIRVIKALLTVSYVKGWQGIATAVSRNVLTYKYVDGDCCLRFVVCTGTWCVCQVSNNCEYYCMYLLRTSGLHHISIIDHRSNLAYRTVFLPLFLIVQP